ncbi:site-specific integrase [Enterococcus florum]|uniref:Site-specific integrase n=1 Tax=Enterococcus florum TaxID=2480627 RepID=A0A4P5P7E1_9ENTE|nr:site-specific integrase [Enterococcus florum]GCF93877.1 site-specific integrase [Enterococcus florum]
MRKGENIYKRKDGRWEGRYFKGRHANGRIKYGYIYGKSYQEVRKKLYEYKLMYQQILDANGDPYLTFQEWNLRWLSEKQLEIKPSTYSSYQYKFHKYVNPIIGHISLNELREKHGDELLKSMQENNLNASSINNIFRLTIKCFQAAKRENKLPINPFDQVKLPKIKREKVRALTKKEQRMLEQAALSEKKEGRLPVFLSLYAGLRIGEISALRWENIDFEENLIRVDSTYQRIPGNKAGEKTQLIYASSKTRSSERHIPFGNKLKQMLLEHKKYIQGEFVFAKNGHPFEPRLITYYFHKIRKRAQLPHIHFHQLRHTFATRCLETNGDIPSVSALLGHASTQMTLDTYADAMLEQRIEVILSMEKGIEID